MADSVRPHRRQPTRVPRPWDSPGKNTGVGCHFLLQCMKVKSESEVTQSCPTLSDPMDCSLPGSAVQGLFQARVLECVASLLPNLNFSLEVKLTLIMWRMSVSSKNHKIMKAVTCYFPSIKPRSWFKSSTVYILSGSMGSLTSGNWQNANAQFHISL